MSIITDIFGDKNRDGRGRIDLSKLVVKRGKGTVRRSPMGRFIYDVLGRFRVSPHVRQEEKKWLNQRLWLEVNNRTKFPQSRRETFCDDVCEHFNGSTRDHSWLLDRLHQLIEDFERQVRT